MPNLTFNNTTLTPIQRDDGQVWLTATELANALGYSRTDKVSQIYNRNADEFSDSMTLNLNLKVKGFGSGNSKKEVRIFNLRGCHLIALFSRTKVAKDFRRWVLDKLDSLDNQQSDRINIEQQQAIKNLIGRIQAQTGLSFGAPYGRFHNKFKIPRYNELPANHYHEAVSYLREKLPVDKPMFQGMSDGRYLLSVTGGQANILDVDGYNLVDSRFVATLRHNLKLLSQQIDIVNGEVDPSLMDVELKELVQI